MKRAVGIICAMALCMSEMQPVLAEDLPVVETESECAEKEETESNTDLTEVQDTEAVTQTETEAKSEPDTNGEMESSETATEPVTESETMTESETESERITEPETESEAVTEEESETETEMETVTETESEGVTENKPDSEIITEPETESKAESGSSQENVPETEAQHKTARQTEPQTEAAWLPEVPSCSLPWTDYGENMEYAEDFRFTQIPEAEWYCTLADGLGNTAVYESIGTNAKQVGEIPYFGKLYILDQVDETWVYVESGNVRGFVKKEELLEKTMAEELVTEIGTEAFPDGEAWCEAADNAAFTYTHTTTRPVLAQKEYAVFLYSGSILEYARKDAREVGRSTSGCLVYILETADVGWLFVESGDVRGFVQISSLLETQASVDLVKSIGEADMPLAQEVISPQENRSCYYTLISVKEACSTLGEQIAKAAQQYVGSLGYVWGGTSLVSGADCSGFTQSLFARFGIVLPRLAEEQGIQGQMVGSFMDAQPGDIVYWSSGPHVGIYIGKGLVVQCSGDSYHTAANPGPGPTISRADYMPVTSIRRYTTQTVRKTKKGSGGNQTDGTVYTQEQLELIWAIVAQEDNGSYDGALAVITSAMNRTESARWSYCGSNALQQLTANGQYCYSIDNYWRSRLGGNVPGYVIEAVHDCLKKGIRNHPYTCFRSTKGKVTGSDAVQIGNGGNWYFGS